MNLTRCENGHFYDAERFEFCPYCNQTSVSTVGVDTVGDNIYTAPVDVKSEVDDVKVDDGSQVTIGYFGEVETEPVVGWLVAIAGNHFGKDFMLKSGRNFIGRSESMDIALTGDPSISRERHAIILYEPKSNVFLVQPGDSKELFYLNGKVVLSAVEIAAYDVLSLGETKLLFIPCCSEKFNWDSVKEENEKK